MRRKKHKWVLTMIFVMTEKQAAAAHDEDAPNVPVETLPIQSSFVFCGVCHGPWVAAHESFCPGPQESMVLPV